MRRRPQIREREQMTRGEAARAGLLTIPQILDMGIGIVDDFGSYARMLQVYRLVRDDMRAKWRSIGRHDRDQFVERLHRAAERFPHRDIEDLGAELYARRFGTDTD